MEKAHSIYEHFLLVFSSVTTALDHLPGQKPSIHQPHRFIPFRVQGATARALYATVPRLTRPSGSKTRTQKAQAKYRERLRRGSDSSPYGNADFGRSR